MAKSSVKPVVKVETPEAEEFEDVVEAYAKTMEELVAEAKYLYEHGRFGVLQQADFFAAVAKLQGEV